VLIAVMLGARALRGSATGSRWRDPVWLGWLAVPMLMVHVFATPILVGWAGSKLLAGERP
jgi:hypothetical protein